VHRLSSSFVLGYHGCQNAVGEALLSGRRFRESNNDYDWLGPGIYFWEANPERVLDFAKELAALNRPRIKRPFVLVAVIEMGLCLDLAARDSIKQIRIAHEHLCEQAALEGSALPKNGDKFWQRDLGCAVLPHLHQLLEEGGSPGIDTMRGLFIEGAAV
jgi:hypothetical protein